MMEALSLTPARLGIAEDVSVWMMKLVLRPLQLLMADGDHIPHDPPLMSKKITIHVVAPATPVADAK